MASFAVSLAGFPRLRVVNAQYLDECSPPGARFDFKSEMIYGFPYKTAHASAIAEGLAALIHTPTRKKGLITDLDDTLWSGILGEVGVEGISWHLDQKTQIHGIYQQFLASLSSAGVLIAIASKNEASSGEGGPRTRGSSDFEDSIFPVEAHWSRKSESIGRILKVWNIAADSVVFLDDSPMEVAEVKSAFPEMECIVFPKTDYVGFWGMLKVLRNLFGKAALSEEDSLRLQSIRDASGFQESLSAGGPSADRFLQEAGASVQFTFGKSPTDTRSFELINKTNQFNLNGGRLNESAWVAFLEDPKSFAVGVSYEDKFGKLGKIGVLLGKVCGQEAFCRIMGYELPGVFPPHRAPMLEIPVREVRCRGNTVRIPRDKPKRPAAGISRADPGFGGRRRLPAIQRVFLSESTRSISPCRGGRTPWLK